MPVESCISRINLGHSKLMGQSYTVRPCLPCPSTKGYVSRCCYATEDAELSENIQKHPKSHLPCWLSGSIPVILSLFTD